MGKLTFQKTHRMLLKSTEEDFKYYTVELDINSGLLRKITVAAKDTLIRVKNEVFGEYFANSKSFPCTVEDIIRIETLFNNVRKSYDWETIELRKTKEEPKDDCVEMPNTSKIQGEEETKVVQQP